MTVRVNRDAVLRDHDFFLPYVSHRGASVSECEASVSPSHMDCWSSTGLSDPEEIEDEEPMAHSSMSACGPPRRSASA